LTHSVSTILKSIYSLSQLLFGSPKAALIPPCAATVCDLVGNNLVIHATLNPASAKPNAALNPAPPAPTTMASYSCSIIGYEEVEVFDWNEDDLVVVTTAALRREEWNKHLGNFDAKIVERGWNEAQRYNTKIDQESVLNH